MEWYWILLIVVLSTILFLALILYILSIVGFITVYSRTEVKSFDKIDLSGTKYKGFEGVLYPAFKFMRALPYEDHYIESFDGLKLHAKYYKGTNNKLMLLVHGYHADPLNNFSIIGKRFLEDGYSLLMIDQRGHGESGGKWTTFGDLESNDILRWMNYIDKNLNEDTIIPYGVSLGCATLEMASSSQMPEKVKCLILDCGYASPLEQMAKSYNDKLGPIGKLVVKMFFRMHAKVIGKFSLNRKCYLELEKATKPCLFIHGGKDSTVPFEKGEKNYNHCGARKEKAFFPDSEHNTCFMQHGDEIIERMNALLSE